jgi:hypothetical protein
MMNEKILTILISVLLAALIVHALISRKLMTEYWFAIDKEKNPKSFWVQITLMTLGVVILIFTAFFKKY